VRIEWRFADGKDERLYDLAAELVKMKVDVIVTHSTPGTKAAQRATSAIPIVMHGIDPVRSGFAASLARPGGNITGQSIIAVDLSPKQIELLKGMLPALSRLALLLNRNPGHPAISKAVQGAAERVSVKALTVNAGSPDDIELAFAVMKREQAEAVLVMADSLFIAQRRQIAQLAVKNRMPSMFWYRDGVEAGGLMSYGQDLVSFYRNAATYVNKILKGQSRASYRSGSPCGSI
jgi:putative ABC transport system substrate-binding protein